MFVSFTSQGYQKNMVYTLYGVNVLDYLELYRKHTFVNQESYKLESHCKCRTR